MLYWPYQPRVVWARDFYSELHVALHIFISRINRAWLYNGCKDSDWQPNIDLAQSVEHWCDDQEVLGSMPFFGWIYFALIRVSFCWQCCQSEQKRTVWMNVSKWWPVSATDFTFTYGSVGYRVISVFHLYKINM